MPQPDDQSDLLRALRALRWPLAGVVGLVFALGRIAESLVLTEMAGLTPNPLIRAIDSLFWGILAAFAVWAVLGWAAYQERRYRTAEARMLAALRESNANLELLNEINQRLVTRATLDEILDYAISLPGRILGARAAALVLRDENGTALTTRSVGLSAEMLEAARTLFPLGAQSDTARGPLVLAPSGQGNAPFRTCVVMPLVEVTSSSANAITSLGWIEIYLDKELRGSRFTSVQRDELSDENSRHEPDTFSVLNDKMRNLLITIAGELTEAIIGARRRVREVASVASLERAIIEERTRIARDLHDGIAQSLAFMRMRIDLWEDWLDQDPEQLRKEFANFKATIRTQIEELRRAIFALRPVELSQLGFEGALRRFVTDFAAQQGWGLTLELSNLPHELPPPLELASFRVVQEALNNVAKHARASNIYTALRLADGGLQIVVRDDGIGFDPGQIPETVNGHLGLRQMRERATALDGHLTLISRPGDGAELRVWLPIMYAAAPRG